MLTDFDPSGDPIVGATANMRTLNVVKKGLDSMVSDAQNPLTGRLSEEGRAIDGSGAKGGRGAYLAANSPR
jgi:hypothetical protein